MIIQVMETTKQKLVWETKPLGVILDGKMFGSINDCFKREAITSKELRDQFVEYTCHKEFEFNANELFPQNKVWTGSNGRMLFSVYRFRIYPFNTMLSTPWEDQTLKWGLSIRLFNSSHRFDCTTVNEAKNIAQQLYDKTINQIIIS